MSPHDTDRLEAVVSELVEALERLNRSLTRLEDARAHHADVVEKLTDERFRTVTR